MQRFDLNQNWEYLESSLQNPLMVGMLQGWKKTSLPHDYDVEKARSPEAATGLDEGFMACAGLYYRKSFTVEPEIIGQRFWLEFEGIAGITEVWLNKKPIAKHNNPYGITSVRSASAAGRSAPSRAPASPHGRG